MKSNVLENIQNSTLKEFREFQKINEGDFELIAGEIMAMSKASINHGLIAKNIANLLDSTLAAKKCVSLVETIEVEIKKRDECFRPDVVVICSPFSGSVSVIENPKIVVEVLSKSSVLLDHNAKREAYLSIDGLVAYLVVSQWKKEVVVYTPIERGYVSKTYTGGETFTLKDWIELNIDEIYETVVF